MPNGHSNKNDYSKLSWAEWKGEVGAQLVILRENVKEIFTSLRKIRDEVAYLKGKAAAWGAVGGSAAGIVVYIIKMATDKG